MAPHLPVGRLVPRIAHAVAVFGDEHKASHWLATLLPQASHWLATPLPLFENRAPSELLESDEGIVLVERTLTRIEHNIPS